MASKQFQLNDADWKSWISNFVRYVAFPVAIAFLGSYSLNYDIKIAYGVTIVTLFNSVQNLFNKWYGGK